MKQRVSEYIRKNYSEGSAPHPRTIIARMRRGEIPDHTAVKEGGMWYVYFKPSTGNPRLDAIIQKVEQNG